MQNWKDELFNILKNQSDAISSTTLAQQLHVSARSIKQQIKVLNTQYENIILASNKGYLLRKDRIDEHMDTTQVSDDRFLYFTQLFFVDHIQSISIYDVCDELFLSYSSIKLLLSKWNQRYKDFHLVLRCKNDAIYLQGSERDKRRFLTDAIYKEASGHMVDTSMLHKHFHTLDISYLQTTLHKTFQYFNCYIHDFGYTNLVLHIAVMLDRMVNGNSMQEDIFQEREEIHPITQDLILDFSNHFRISFNTYEQQNMNALIIANINFSQGKNEEELRSIVGDDIYKMTIDIIDNINVRYDLRLNKETLLFPLSLHFKNLFQRSKQESMLRNPLRESIQSSCPLLYDCAIFIAEYLHTHFEVFITQDETAYLAMHIGADIERQQKDNKKLQCALLCPDYQQNQQQIYNYLLIHFDSDITITNVCSYEQQLQDLQVDIIFSTIPLGQRSISYLQIAPMKQAIDLKEIYAYIQQQIDKRKLQVLYESFPTYFNEQLFYYDSSTHCTRDEILQTLCKQLVKEDYVHPHFYHDVCKREEATSTAFGQIAIPHSMNMDAYQTGIAVAISPHGITWNEQRIHLVLMISINEHDSYVFKELYEALILLCSQSSSIALLKQCKTFEDFKNIVYHLQ